MDYVLAVMIFIALALNFALLCGLISSCGTNVIFDLFDKKLKQYRLADSLAKAVEKNNKNFKAVVIISGDYEILIARKVKDSNND